MQNLIELGTAESRVSTTMIMTRDFSAEINIIIIGLGLGSLYSPSSSKREGIELDCPGILAKIIL